MLRPYVVLAIGLLAAPGCERADVGAQHAAPYLANAEAAARSTEGQSLHFTRLRALAPDELLGYVGGKIEAHTSRMGAVATTELERTYTRGGNSLKLRLVDTNLTGGARPPRPGPDFEDDVRLGRPLRIAGASGYAEFEKDSLRASASLIVADRVLISLTMEDARGVDELEQFAAALDLERLEALLDDAR